MRRIALLFYCVLVLSLGWAQAQSISFITQTSNTTTCGMPTGMGVIYQNLGVDTLRNVQVAVTLPTGVQYVPGSLVGPGFAELNISTLDSVIFSSTDLPPLRSDTFLILIQARCGAEDSAAVTNGVYVMHSMGTVFGNTIPYSILSPALSIQSVTPASFTGPLGANFQRCISVINGGYGAVSHFSVVLESAVSSLVQSGFTLTANGTPLFPVVSGDSMTLTFGPAQIQAIGDLDTLFEQNEVINFCFQVQVIDCIDLSTAISTSWGCDAVACETQTSGANVIVPALVPNVVTTDFYVENRCYGGGTPSLIKIVLRNTGTGPARDIVVDLWQGEPTGPSNGYISRLDSNNILLKSTLNGVTNISPFAVEVQSPGANLGCLGPNPLRRIKVRIPFLQPGERDTLIIEQFTCCKSWCANAPTVMQRTHYQVEYHDQCFTSNFVLPANIVTSWNFGRVISFTNSGLYDIPLGDSANYEIEHSDFRFFNFSPGGYAWVDVVVPPGLEVLTTPGTIRFEDVNGDLWNPYNVITSGDTVRAFFSLPQPGPFSLEKALFKFRMTNDCSGGPCSGGPKTVQYSIHQIADLSCGCKSLIGCHSFVVNSHCGICPTTCVNGGMLFTGFESYRKNYGLPDNDNNGLADGFGVIDMQRVRTRHLMLRDTLVTKFHGIVDTTALRPFWAEGFARSTITRGTSLTPVRYHVRIVDVSTNTTYNCNLAAPTFTTVGSTRTFSYNLSVASLAACLPPGFVYEVNDTVDVTAEYVVSNNIGSLVEAQTITNQFFLQPNGGGLQASCDNYSGGFVLVGYYYTSSGPDEFSANGCNNVTVTENYYLSIGNCCSNYAGGNIFDYEFRHWGIPQLARFYVPNGYSFVSASLRHYRTSGSQASVNTLLPITPVSISNDTIYFNLAAQFVNNGGTLVLGDDGYIGTVNVVLRPSCRVLPDIMQPVKYFWNFAPIPALTGPGSVAPTQNRVDSISYESPSLTINPTLPNAPGISSVVSWEFTLENNSNLASATNAWFALVSPSGLIVPTSVRYLFNNSLLTPVGGIYAIGTLPQDSARSYRITADYANCSPDSLRIVAGWDCNSIPANLGAYPCTLAEAWVYVQPQPSVLQATFATEPGPHGICDSLRVDVQVVSSQLARVKDILVGIGLPLSGGLTYSMGSAQMQYPLTAGFVSIPNPTIAGNLLTWDINTVNALISANDLPGTTRPDSNIFNLRFYLYTNCDMISGDRIRLRLDGNRGCGDALTPVLMLSDPIQIQGAVQPYVTHLTASAVDGPACPVGKTITINMVNAGATFTNAGDSLFVNLSPGYSYAGGFLSQLNAPSNTNPQVQSSPGGVRMGWEIPSALAVGDTMRFTFNVIAGDIVPCGTDIATVQTVTTQTLFCARTLTNCTASTQTGSTVLNLSIVRPNLNFSAFNSTIQPIVGGSTYTYTGTLQNTGPAIAPGVTVTVSFYCDNDNSNGYSPGDIAVGTYSTTAGITNGGTHNLSGNFFIPTGSCGLGNSIYALVVPNSGIGLCICDTASSNTNVILPVEWLSVTGEALPMENEVRWEVNLMPDHDYFVLQKLTTNGWNAISPRLSDRQSSFAWQDAAPLPVEYYRVQEADVNGQFHYSQQVEIVRDGFAEFLKVYPNPSRGTAFLQATAGANFRIYNAFGQVITEGTLPDGRPVEISTASMAAGMYLVEFRQGGRQATLRLIVE